MGSQAVSGSSTGKIGLADAPPVELALSRSKLYLLLSWGFLYPEEDEFYNYLQERKFAILSLRSEGFWSRSRNGRRRISRPGNSATSKMNIAVYSRTSSAWMRLLMRP